MINKKRSLSYFLLILSAVVLAAVDQLIKAWAVGALAGKESIVLIPGVFQLTYVENRGAAFGLFQGQFMILAVVTMIITVLLLWVYKDIKEAKGAFLLKASFALIISGAFGNLIDRFFRSFVVDMFDFCLINFPVFNFADICVCVGTGLIILCLLIHPSLFDGLFDSRKKKNSENL